MSAERGAKQAEQAAEIEFDTSDVERWVGIPLAGRRLKEPIQVNDVRRWVQGMQNPNPLYFDEDYASQSRFGQIVAPQSFSPCCSDSAGTSSAIQGRMPGTHVLFGGDEWWFYGPRILPGDKIITDRMLFDWKVAETSFGGPTLFTRGDTTYINQRGEIICKQRATAIRYRADEAVKRQTYKDDVAAEWTDEQLEKLEKQRFDWIQGFRELGHERRLFVKAGDKLPTCVIGPHTTMSLATEWLSLTALIWATMRDDGSGFTSTEGADYLGGDAGWLPELTRDPEGAKIDPSHGDAMLHGPARGHMKDRYAHMIGLPRAYGYGLTMGAWVTDYLTNWVGEWGEVIHSNVSYRSPSFVGDAAFINGEVVDVSHDDPRGLGRPVATVKVTMKNQRDGVMASGRAELRLPTETMPAASPV